MIFIDKRTSKVVELLKEKCGVSFSKDEIKLISNAVTASNTQLVRVIVELSDRLLVQTLPVGTQFSAQDYKSSMAYVIVEEDCSQFTKLVSDNLLAELVERK